jgi:hypothetical protein
MFVVGFTRGQGAAAPEIKFLAHDRQGAPERSRIGERAKVARSIILPQPCQSEARYRIIQIDLQEKKAFVIAEADIVAGMEFLDQLAFEEQSLRFTPNDMGIKIVDRFDQCAEFKIPTLAAGGMKVLGDTPAQVSRFAHINDRAKAVFHQVDPWPMRYLAKLGSNLLGCWHREMSCSARPIATGFSLGTDGRA